MLTIVYFAWVRERIGLDEEQVVGVLRCVGVPG